MGYIKEPKNVDFVVGPSVLDEETKRSISQAIAQYKKSKQTVVAGMPKIQSNKSA